MKKNNPELIGIRNALIQLLISMENSSGLSSSEIIELADAYCEFIINGKTGK